MLPAGSVSAGENREGWVSPVGVSVSVFVGGDSDIVVLTCVPERIGLVVKTHLRAPSTMTSGVVGARSAGHRHNEAARENCVVSIPLR
jgi:hypothetical protein